MEHYSKGPILLSEYDLSVRAFMAPYRQRKIWIRTPSATIGCQDYMEDDLGRKTTTNFARFANVQNKIDVANYEKIQITR